MSRVLNLYAMQNDLRAYDPYSSSHGELKEVLSYIILNEEQTKDTVELMEQLGEELPVKVLLSRENLSGPPTLYRILRDYLVQHRF